MHKFEIYTDGSAKGRWGSWAYVIVQNGVLLGESSGRVRKTNSNRMEFQAVIEGLKGTPRDSHILIFCDCRVLLDKVPLFAGLSAGGWKKNERLIANHDLYAKIYELLQIRQVTWKWVRAHSGNLLNERCDELCVLARNGDHLNKAAIDAGSMDRT